MDPELQAIREARLAQLKSNGGGANGDRNGGASNGGGDNSAPVGAAIANFLEPQALERLSRVALVRRDRAQAVEAYLKKLIGTNNVTHKITENEIVSILNGIAKQQNSQSNNKIIFDRKNFNEDLNSFDKPNARNDNNEDDDDFFD
ncbi:hypothetical protein SUVZ_13G2090 [Saccharomyces uvarum]|uniref:YMR074C-like protein n=1 Tax=Saccharomyces uvarum TaxID=230603 RepID=A0ABN8WK62_SACUV|nr:hypothetical protein SUVZ_13G2090 [Saccharomyces uvarum]